MLIAPWDSNFLFEMEITVKSRVLTRVTNEKIKNSITKTQKETTHEHWGQSKFVFCNVSSHSFSERSGPGPLGPVRKILVVRSGPEGPQFARSVGTLHCRFDCHYIGHIYGGDFAKFCGLLSIYELYQSDRYSLLRFCDFVNNL